MIPPSYRRLCDWNLGIGGGLCVSRSGVGWSLGRGSVFWYCIYVTYYCDQVRAIIYL